MEEKCDCYHQCHNVHATASIVTSVFSASRINCGGRWDVNRGISCWPFGRGHIAKWSINVSSCANMCSTFKNDCMRNRKKKQLSRF